MDTERFCGYWNEAVTAVVYAIHEMRKPVLCGQINECFREELLDRRFFSTGIRHGAAEWLAALEQEDPQKARQLCEALRGVRFTVGLGPAQAGVCAAGAAAAVGGYVLGRMGKASPAAKAGGLAAGVLGLGLLGKGGLSAAGASDAERLSEQLRGQAQEQLGQLLAILEG